MLFYADSASANRASSDFTKRKVFIEIVIQPYYVPVSLRGRHYYRSDSVKQELTDAALNEFLLKRAGYTWDDVIEQRASFDDIDEQP